MDLNKNGQKTFKNNNDISSGLRKKGTSVLPRWSLFRNRRQDSFVKCRHLKVGQLKN